MHVENPNTYIHGSKHSSLRVSVATLLYRSIKAQILIQPVIYHPLDSANIKLAAIASVFSAFNRMCLVAYSIMHAALFLLFSSS